MKRFERWTQCSPIHCQWQCRHESVTVSCLLHPMSMRARVDTADVNVRWKRTLCLDSVLFAPLLRCFFALEHTLVVRVCLCMCWDDNGISAPCCLRHSQYTECEYSQQRYCAMPERMPNNGVRMFATTGCLCRPMESDSYEMLQQLMKYQFEIRHYLL